MRGNFHNVSLPFCRAWVLLLAAIVAPISMEGQSAAQPKEEGPLATPAFEVASVKPDPKTPQLGVPPLCLVSCDPLESFKIDGSRVNIRYYTLLDLIRKAYRLKPYQLSDANSDNKSYWDLMTSRRFDIAAKIPDDVPVSLVPEMLQDLLAQRFKLSLHRATRDMPVYALVVEKNGPKLKDSAPDADTPVPDTPGSSRIDTPQGEARYSKEGYAISSGPYGPIRVYVDQTRTIHTDFLRVSMAQLVELLDQDRPVIDNTNLKGYYQFSILRLSQAAASAAGEPVLGPREVARQALAKAGLKLEPATAPLDMIVIDHLEKSPSAN